jgi:ABC-type polysaccharide/polyol phosphate export permease
MVRFAKYSCTLVPLVAPVAPVAYHPPVSHRFSLSHALHVVLALGWSDFVLKYRGSTLGYLWSFASPLLYFFVLLHVFRPYVSDEIRSYPLYLFLGIIVWEHFSVTTSGCMAMLHDKSSIIQKVVIPKILLILAVGWTNVIIVMTRLAVFVVIAAWLDVPFTLGYLYLPLLIVQMTLLALGVGMLLSSYALRFKDISHLWAVILQAVFWLTPIAYPQRTRPVVDQVLATLREGGGFSLGRVIDAMIQFQPLSLVVGVVRRSILQFNSLDVPSAGHMALVSAVCGLIFAAGALVYARRSKYFIQEF